MAGRPHPIAAREPARVRAMFDSIAGGYDRANSVLSLRGDERWRRWAASAAAVAVGGRALDVACGTGMLTRELRSRVGVSGRVVGVDTSERMLDVARAHGGDVEWVCGDACALPFGDGSFDAATIAFGLRNLVDPDVGLREMHRVVRAGGRLVILEFLRPPSGALGSAYRLYLRHVLPRLGGRLTGRPDAYRYLSETVDSYLREREMLDLALAAGWQRPRLWRLNLGTVALVRGTAGPRPPS